MIEYKESASHAATAEDRSGGFLVAGVATVARQAASNSLNVYPEGGIGEFAPIELRSRLRRLFNSIAYIFPASHEP
jgi:hypothetical protein